MRRSRSAVEEDRVERHRRVVALAIGLLVSPLLAAEPSVPRVLGLETAPALAGVTLPEGTIAVALGENGRRAAVAVGVDGARPARFSLRLHVAGGTGPRALELAGSLRDLRFAPAGPTLLAVVQVPARRRDGDVYLMRVEVEASTARRLLRLPATARALEFWPEARSLLVGCTDEIRTFLWPELRSGPLLRAAGEHRALLLASGGRLLSGQTNRLLVVELTDAPREEGLTVREQIELPASAVGLALQPSGPGALVQLADGRIAELGLAPLTLREIGTGLVARRSPSDWPAEATPARPTPPPPRAPPEPAPSPGPEPPAQGGPPPTIPAPAANPAREPAGQPATSGDGILRGRLTGAALEGLVVVLWGPDHILREARRAAPAADGLWEARGLAPGRYRVTVEGGGGRVPTTEPGFRIVQVDPRGIVDGIDFRVLGAL
jgi:hypothetical protein